MKTLKRLLFTLMLAALPFGAFAKEDPVLINKITFTNVQSSEIKGTAQGGYWTRIEVLLEPKSNPDEKANNPQWIRDVELTLTLIYQDQKAQNKKSADSKIVLKSKARLFAVKIGGPKVPVVFYIPSEAYGIYRLGKEPFSYSIDLSVNGAAIPLTRDNIKTMLSKRILKSGDPKKVYENYLKFVQSASATNENVLMALPDCPFNVKYYEYFSGAYVPTYIKVSSN